jgi:cell division protein FtsA
VIRSIVEEKKLNEETAGGFVLTGGGALIKGMPELGEYILMRSCKIGYPIPFGGMTNIMQNPKYSTVLGLLMEASKRKPYTPTQSQNNNVNHRVKLTKDNDPKESNKDLVHKLSESLRSVFKEIF